MVRKLLPFAAALAACAPSPKEAAAMRTTNSPPGSAAQGPIPESVSAAGNPAPAPPADSPAAAIGRRTLSTAYVRVGPDGHLTVELQGGRVLVLRDVVLRRKDYCGVQVLGGPAGAKYCGGYAEVAAARPGGAPSL
jgi:hypothetical protein